AAGRTYRSLVARVPRLSPRPHVYGRDTRGEPVPGDQRYLMSNTLTYGTSRPRRVQVDQVLTRGVSHDVPEVILSTQIPLATFFSTPRTPKSHLRTCTATLLRLALRLRSEVYQPFNAQREGVVRRFSPIHF